jgi:hypothetical protein
MMTMQQRRPERTRTGGVQTVDGDIPHEVVRMGRMVIEAPVMVMVLRAHPDLSPLPLRDRHGNPLRALPGGGVLPR